LDDAIRITFRGERNKAVSTYKDHPEKVRCDIMVVNIRENIEARPKPRSGPQVPSERRTTFIREN
ncbi:MAG: hypothetical protein QGG53_35615, partial [Planctomycetota bacterium]|jgi:hypothetical protein|nr:hypothetical protein [Planctomycetota bacterium]